MRRLGVSLFIVAALWVQPARAQDLRVMLTPREAASLPTEARAVYDLAVQENDRVNYDEVARLLARASEKAPEHAPLQFLALARAVQRAEVYYSTNSFSPSPEGLDFIQPPLRVSEPFYDLAESVLQRLQANPALSSEQKNRLDKAVTQVEKGRSGMTERDEARLKAGAPLVDEIRDKRVAERGIGAATLDPLDPLNVLMADSLTKKEPTAPKIATGAANTDPKYRQPIDPFADLPGEYRDSFVPISQLLLNGLTQLNQGVGQAAQGIENPFGAPGAAPADGAADPFGAPDGGAPPAAPGNEQDPFAAPADGGGGK